jgi:hypothetical protein
MWASQKGSDSTLEVVSAAWDFLCSNKVGRLDWRSYVLSQVSNNYQKQSLQYLSIVFFIGCGKNSGSGFCKE